MPCSVTVLVESAQAELQTERCFILRFTMSLPIATLHLTFPGGCAEAWSTITPSQALSFGAAIGAKGALGDGALG